jgi:hypothetical protein
LEKKPVVRTTQRAIQKQRNMNACNSIKSTVPRCIVSFDHTVMTTGIVLIRRYFKYFTRILHSVTIQTTQDINPFESKINVKDISKFSIQKTHHLMPFREMTAVWCKNRRKCSSHAWGRHNADYLNVNACGTHSDQYVTKS